jgi:hypothetical protein
MNPSNPIAGMAVRQAALVASQDAGQELDFEKQ